MGISLVGSLRRLHRDESGNIGILFALMSIPMFGMIGAALDYSRAVSAKTKLQAAVDAAAVSGAVAFRDTGDTNDAADRIEKHIRTAVEEMGLELAAGDGTDGGVVLTNGEYNPATGSASPTLQYNVPTTIMGILGFDEIPLEVTGTAAMTGKNLELSLMLDVTGSMGWYANGTRKLDDLKLAANDLLDIFDVNLSAGATKIALVPFSNTVNVGPTLAPLVRGNQPATKTYSYYYYGRRYTYTYHLTNCVTERTGSDAYTDTAPGSGTWLDSYYRYGSSNCTPTQEVVPLTSSKSTLSNVINSLTASGSTAGHLGTAWAWYTISDKWSNVFSGDSAPAPADPSTLIKATILMTDGDYNTDYDGPSSSYQAAQLCTQMKAAGIVVYSVGFGISAGSSQEQLMKDCASGSDKYFFPYNGEALRAAFQEIGRQLRAGQAGIQLIN